MIKNKINKVLNEIDGVLRQVDEKQVSVFIDDLFSSKKIVIIGAGRIGMTAKAFAMRLMHLGLEAYTLNDCNLPSIGNGDLLVVCSGSGETQTIYDLAVIAKNRGVKILLVTANPDSRIGVLADHIVQIKAPSKVSTKIKSIQPMTTLTEQSFFIFFDSLVLEIMKKKKITSDQMKVRHSILE